MFLLKNNVNYLGLYEIWEEGELIWSGDSFDIDCRVVPLYMCNDNLYIMCYNTGCSNLATKTTNPVTIFSEFWCEDCESI